MTRALLAVAVVLAGGCAGPDGAGRRDGTALGATAAHQPVRFETEYQAVLMTNGQVFIGALDGFGTTTPMLRDVHYVRTVPGKTAADPTSTTLVKRGQEWHSPNTMYLNPAHIVLVEPVTPTSKVAALIAQSLPQ